MDAPAQRSFKGELFVRVSKHTRTATLRSYTLRMQMAEFPFSTTDWRQVPTTEHPGDCGVALWRTKSFGDIRVRMVEYSPGYEANHWCSKGHVLLCLDGELETRLTDGRSFTLKAGMSYQVGDGDPPHRSFTEAGAKLFIVD
jgi:hypothetical protein